MISSLNVNMNKIIYTSGNESSLKNSNSDVKKLIPNFLLKDLSYFNNRYLKKSRKGRSDLFEDELSIISKIEPNSYVTELLKDILLNRYNKVPHIRLTFTIQSFLFLASLENKKNLTFIME